MKSLDERYQHLVADKGEQNQQVPNKVEDLMATIKLQQKAIDKIQNPSVKYKNAGGKIRPKAPIYAIYSRKSTKRNSTSICAFFFREDKAAHFSDRDDENLFSNDCLPSGWEGCSLLYS